MKKCHQAGLNIIRRFHFQWWKPALFGLVLQIAFSVMATGRDEANEVEVTVTFAAAVWDIDRSLIDYVLKMDEEGTPVSAPRVYLAMGEKYLEIEIPYASMSTTTQYRGPADLTFYLSEPDPLSGVLPPVAGRVQIPKGMTDVLLIFFPIAIERGEYRIIPLNVEERIFPANGIQIFNLSNNDLHVLIGGARSGISASERVLLEAPDPRRSFRISVVGWDELKDNWKVYYNRYQQPLNNQRLLCFITVDPVQPDRYSVRFMSVRRM